MNSEGDEISPRSMIFFTSLLIFFTSLIWIRSHFGVARSDLLFDRMECQWFPFPVAPFSSGFLRWWNYQGETWLLGWSQWTQVQRYVRVHSGGGTLLFVRMWQHRSSCNDFTDIFWWGWYWRNLSSIFVGSAPLFTNISRNSQPVSFIFLICL